MKHSREKVNLSSKMLSEARKKAIKEAYIPKNIRGSCKIAINSSGEVTVSRKK